MGDSSRGFRLALPDMVALTAPLLMDSYKVYFNCHISQSQVYIQVWGSNHRAGSQTQQTHCKLEVAKDPIYLLTPPHV